MIFTLKTEVSLLTDVFSKVFQACVFSHCGLGPVFFIHYQILREILRFAQAW